MSGINVAAKSVTVEWIERGETKGKEVIFKASDGSLINPRESYGAF